MDGEACQDEDEDSGSEAYPDEVLKVLRGLKDGEVADNIIEMRFPLSI